jgi:hypothetical protein
MSGSDKYAPAYSSGRAKSTAIKLYAGEARVTWPDRPFNQYRIYRKFAGISQLDIVTGQWHKRNRCRLNIVQDSRSCSLMNWRGSFARQDNRFGGGIWRWKSLLLSTSGDGRLHVRE